MKATGILYIPFFFLSVSQFASFVSTRLVSFTFARQICTRALPLERIYDKVSEYGWLFVPLSVDISRVLASVCIGNLLFNRGKLLAVFEEAQF